LDENPTLKIEWLARRGKLGKEFQSLCENGSLWIETDEYVSEKSRQLPPYEFCFDIETGDPLHGFPLNLDDLKDDLRAFFDMCQHDAKQEAIAKSVQLKAKNKTFFIIESDDEADEGLAEIAHAEDDVVLCIVDDDNLILPPEEQKRVSAHESRQVQEERARVEDELNKLFMLATADREKLDKICQAIESKAQAKELDISNKWKIMTGIACEDPLLIWARAEHSQCKTIIQLWKAKGVQMPSIEVIDWEKKFFSNVRLNLNNLEKHQRNCRIESSDKEPPRKSSRTKPVQLRVQDVASAIKSTFGIWLYKCNNRVFQSPAYRARHVSPAIKWIGFFLHNQSVFSHLKVSCSKVFISLKIKMIYFFLLRFAFAYGCGPIVFAT
jgi:hypothetical protein